MITQMKRWLQKLFAWWPWREEPVSTYAPMEHRFNMGVSAEPFPRPPVDGAIPQSGMAPQIGNQGEPRCSTIEEWREAHPAAASPPPGSNNDWHRESPPQPPTPLTESGKESLSASGEMVPPSRPPVQLPSPVSAPAPIHAEPLAPRSTAEQHLEFLRYLVQRGIVNEGFTGGDTPEQYKSK